MWSFEQQLGKAEAEGTEAARSAVAAALAAHSDGREAADPTYLQLFLLKYVCSEPDCFGTLVPLAPDATTHACNLCGAQRTDAEFMAELESSMAT